MSSQDIRCSQADLVLLAHEAFYDSHRIRHVARELENDPERDPWLPSWGWWPAQRERTGIDIEPDH